MSIKLSPKQKEVIRLMQRDWTLRRDLRVESPKLTSPKKYSQKRILFATAKRLMKLKLISFQIINGSYSPSFVEYCLTDLGNNIKL